jgi:hypothetical protein
MARNKPTIIQSHTDKKSYIRTDILKSEAIYALFYDNEPVNIRRHHTLLDGTFKYLRVCSPNCGHLFVLRDRLNKLFKTNKFAVVKFSMGTVIHGK